MTEVGGRLHLRHDLRTEEPTPIYLYRFQIPYKYFKVCFSLYGAILEAQIKRVSSHRVYSQFGCTMSHNSPHGYNNDISAIL